MIVKIDLSKEEIQLVDSWTNYLEMERWEYKDDPYLDLMKKIRFAIRLEAERNQEFKELTAGTLTATDGECRMVTCHHSLGSHSISGVCAQNGCNCFKFEE